MRERVSTSLGCPPAAITPSKTPSSRQSMAVIAVNAIRLPFDQPATSACISSVSHPVSASRNPCASKLLRRQIHRAFQPNEAAQESNLPDGLHRPTGFEDNPARPVISACLADLRVNDSPTRDPVATEPRLEDGGRRLSRVNDLGTTFRTSGLGAYWTFLGAPGRPRAWRPPPSSRVVPSGGHRRARRRPTGASVSIPV
jgi:hypothetical protein